MTGERLIRFPQLAVNFLHSITMTLQEMLLTYGYPVLFLGVQLEGEVFIVLAVYLAQRGYFSLTGIILVAALSSFLSTQLHFYLGHRYGRGFLVKRPHWQARVSRIPALLQRYGAGLVMGYRALYGIRVVIPPALGFLGYSAVRFSVLDGFGALLWASIVTLAGRQLAQLAETQLANLRNHEGTILITLICAGVLWSLIRFVRQYRLTRMNRLKGSPPTFDDPPV